MSTTVESDGVVRMMEALADADHPDHRYYRETYDHIQEVAGLLQEAIWNLSRRRKDHDRSKLENPEREGFQAMTADARLKDLEYNSEAYQAVLAEHRPTIGHHYAENDHHPEHFAVFGPGVLVADPNYFDDELVASGYAWSQMSLMAKIEALCDWCASGTRMKRGNILESIRKNQARFGYSDAERRCLENTARELGMIDGNEAPNGPAEHPASPDSA